MPSAVQTMTLQKLAKKRCETQSLGPQVVSATFPELCMCLQTIALRECMLAHKEYYAPLLEEEERDMERQQLEKEEEGEQRKVEEEEEEQVKLQQ